MGLTNPKPRSKPPSRKLVFQPRRTIFCFHHFCHLAALDVGEVSCPATTPTTNQTSSKWVSRRCAASGKVKKPTPLPTRVQPRRAVKDKSKGLSTPEENQASKTPTTKHKPKQLSFDSFASLPPSIESTRLSVLEHTKPFREEIGRRVGTPSMRCSFGSRRWTCDVCHFHEEQTRQYLEEVARQTVESAVTMALKQPCAPIADMTPSVEGSCATGHLDWAEFAAWDAATVFDTETVRIGDMQFALDMCDGTLKFMFLAASKTGR
jgi:hypothetical protein